MSLTRTTNGGLALHTFLDASHISRLRRGERKPAKKENYVRIMASYLGKRCVEDYQRQALLDALGARASVFEDPENLTELVYRWLLDERFRGAAGAGEAAANSPAGFRFRGRAPEEDGRLQDLLTKGRGASRGAPGGASCDVSPGMRVYYGIDGKREAVVAFLSLVLNAEKPGTLLLFSDEDFGWVSEDPAFAVQWAKLMSQVIMKGNRIKMIHTVSRHLDEMLEGLVKWMPLYMTGAIEPYYYPKKRDGVFNRSLFVAPGTAAVTSTSVGDMTDKAANFLMADAKAVEAITHEYENYFRLCRPLMRIFGPREHLVYLGTLREFEGESADAMMMTGSLSLLTAPVEVAEAMFARAPDELMQHFRVRKRCFEENLGSNHFTEIVRIPDISLVREGKVRAGLSGLMMVGDICYTVDEFRRHLENMVALMEEYEKYHVCMGFSEKPH